MNIIPIFDHGRIDPSKCNYLFCEGHISTVRLAMDAHDANRVLTFLDEVLVGPRSHLYGGSLSLGSLIVTVGQSNSPEVSHDGQMQQVVMIYPHGDYPNMKVAEPALLLYSRLKEAIASANQVATTPV